MVLNAGGACCLLTDLSFILSSSLHHTVSVGQGHSNWQYGGHAESACPLIPLFLSLSRRTNVRLFHFPPSGPVCICMPSHLCLQDKRCMCACVNEQMSEKTHYSLLFFLLLLFGKKILVFWHFCLIDWILLCTFYANAFFRVVTITLTGKWYKWKSQNSTRPNERQFTPCSFWILMEINRSKTIFATNTRDIQASDIVVIIKRLYFPTHFTSRDVLYVAWLSIHFSSFFGSFF